MKLIKLPLYYKFENQKYVYVNPEGVEAIINWQNKGQVRIFFKDHSMDIEGELDNIVKLLKNKGVDDD